MEDWQKDDCARKIERVLDDLAFAENEYNEAMDKASNDWRKDIITFEQRTKLLDDIINSMIEERKKVAKHIVDMVAECQI